MDDQCRAAGSTWPRCRFNAQEALVLASRRVLLVAA